MAVCSDKPGPTTKSRRRWLGNRRWELDVTYLTICLWERIGLVTDVVRPKRRSENGGLGW